MFANMSWRLSSEDEKQEMAYSKLLLNIMLLLCTLHYCETLYAGERSLRSCERSWDGAQGVCLPLSECTDLRPAQGAFGNTIRRPDICEPYGRMPIVCCVPKKPLSTEELAQTLSLSSSIRELAPPQQEPLWRQKCKEYAKLVYEVEGISDSKPKPAQCAQSPRPTVGRAQLGEFPHMAAVGYEIEDEVRFQCGGSLISERYVITAAHCIYGSVRSGRPRWVLLGTVTLNATNPHRQLIRVSQLIPHPDYKHPQVYFDVGLLQLKSNARLGPYVRPACLSSDRDTSTLQLSVTGWGAVDFGKESSNSLLKTNLIQAPYEVCSHHYDKAGRRISLGVHNASMMCAGHPNLKSDSCQGDSGGPLQVISSDLYCMYEIIGIVSFGKACGVGIPGIYTRVAFFRSWIEDVLWSY